MIDINDFLVSSVSESYTISKIEIDYNPYFKKVGEGVVIKGVISVSFVDTNDITKERANLNETDVNAYFYSIATGTDAQKQAFATTSTLNLFKDLNNGIEQPTIDMVLAKYNLTV
jgi:hypothetical protein